MTHSHLSPRQKVYLGLSDLDEHGFDQKGALLKAINRAMMR